MKQNAPTDYRSAKTGKFVTEEFAERHPATTVGEHNKLLPLEEKPKR